MNKAEVSQLINDNLLDNAYWAAKEYVVNQGGFEVYPATGVYAFDRWYLWSLDSENPGSVTLRENGITLAASSAEKSSIVMDQIFEHPEIFKNCRMIASILVASITGEFELQITNNHSLVFDKPGVIFITGTVHNFEETKGPRFRIHNVTPNATCTLQASKFEFGSCQTIAYKEGEQWVLNDPPPNKALELAKCQRYQRSIEKVYVYFGNIINGNLILSTSVPLGNMRIAPAVTVKQLNNPYVSTIPFDETKIRINASATQFYVEIIDSSLVNLYKNHTLTLVDVFADANL